MKAMKEKEARELRQQLDLWRDKYESLELQYDKMRERLVARMLTSEDIQDLKEEQFIWIQTKIGGLYCLQIAGLCGIPGRYTDIQFVSTSTYEELSISRYRFAWVAWTAQPTGEQIHGVKWK